MISSGRMADLTCGLTKSSTVSDTGSGSTTHHIPSPSGSDLPRTETSRLAAQTNLVLYSNARLSRSSAIDSSSMCQARVGTSPQITCGSAVGSAHFCQNLATRMPTDSESRASVRSEDSKRIRIGSLNQCRTNANSIDREPSVIRATNRLMRFPDNSPDPFACTATSITQQIHTCLVYFESLWISRSTAGERSSGRQIVRKCTSDELHMACIVAAMASRLENFHGLMIPGGSSRYVVWAVEQLRLRLAENSSVQSEDVYAILKLYVAEAYRANLDGALIHLNGAAAAYERLNNWKSFDLDMAVTLCGTGEAFFLPQVWRRPTTFKTIADPGPARACFSHVPFWGVNEPDPNDRLATLLISSFRTRDLEPTQLDVRQSILNDMIEYTRVRQKMLQIVAEGTAIPKDVACWAHLRRINLVFRLLSVDTSADLLSHCVRISLITWLAIVSDLNGFGRNLEIVASHLRRAIQSLTGPEMSTHSMLVIWMMFLGAVTGMRASDGLWFSRCLAEFLIKTNTVSEMNREGLTVFMETVNEGFFYCAGLQRQSVQKVASRLHLHSLSLSTKAAA